jgi:hypothetical protein
MEARLGDGIQFQGYDFDSDEVRAGGNLQSKLYWQALQELQVSYTVFTHLFDPENQIRGQMDSIPVRGQVPTSSWVEGEVISDEYEIVVDREAPMDKYVMEIGMYDAGTGARLPVLDAQGQPRDDRILLQSIQVLAPAGE